MKELSLNILDITHNSITAKAKNISISLEYSDDMLAIIIKDDGCGMDKEMLEKVTDPFTTSRTSRRVGLGIPLFKLAAEQTGGELLINSEKGKGTEVSATFHTDHIDCPPLGDIASTVSMLAAAIPEDCRLTYKMETPKGSFELDTDQIKEVLGSRISLSEPEIQEWIRVYITEQELKIV